MLARSAAVLTVRRCLSCSSPICAPPDASASSPPIIHSCSKPGSRSRTLLMIFSCALVSAKMARAAESLRIHSTCSADEVSYTGTVTAPAAQVA